MIGGNITANYIEKEGFTTNNTNESKDRNGVSAIVLILTVLCEVLLGGMLWMLRILPGKYLALVLAALAAVAGVLGLLLRRPDEQQKGRGKRIFAYILCAIVMASCLVGTHALVKFQETVTAISNIDSISTVFGVYVLAEDPAQTMEDAADYDFAITGDGHSDTTAAAVESLSPMLGSGSIRNLESVTAMLEALFAGDVQAIILNQSYADVMMEVEGYNTFFTKARMIYEHTVVETVESTTPVKEETPDETEPEPVVIDPTKMPFVVYLSGSDTRSSTLVKGRSDVNILATVNPVTKQILLVNTPRDYYVSNPAGGGEKDKLTHCGLYGIENSMEALSDLYGQPVTYYAQINFTGFERLVNAVGGITVYSDVAFEAAEAEFKVYIGNNYMNGTQALAFARERHNLRSGDIARGKNQMRVIAAIVDKLSAGTILKNYSAILDSLQGMFVTNMSSDEISDLIKMQLDDMAKWEVLTYSVTGEGGADYNYSMRDVRSYVMYPNEEMINLASSLMGKVLNGETITQSDITGE